MLLITADTAVTYQDGGDGDGIHFSELINSKRERFSLVYLFSSIRSNYTLVGELLGK
jgi:hypothetical protein